MIKLYRLPSLIHSSIKNKDLKKNLYFIQKNQTSALMWSANSAVHKLNIIGKECFIIYLSLLYIF